MSVCARHVYSSIRPVWGVIATGSPAHPMVSERCWSVKMKTIFGFCICLPIITTVDKELGRLFKILPGNWATIDKLSILDSYLSSTPNEMFGWAIPLEFGALRARYQGRQVGIVVMEPSHSVLGESTTTMITSYDQLRTRKAILVPIQPYTSLTDVIAAHQTIRDSYNPADLQVSKYDRMQLLVTLLHAVLFFTAKSYKLKTPLSRLEPHEGDYHRDFVLPEDVERLKRLDST